MSYNHATADALALAATCEKRVSSGTGVALNAAATDMVAKALKFWAEHKPKFEDGDMIVYESSGSPKDLFTVLETDGTNDILVQRFEGCDFWSKSESYRLATPAEIAAGHRIDEVQGET